MNIFTYDAKIYNTVANPDPQKISSVVPFQPIGGSIYVFRHEGYEDSKAPRPWRADGYVYGQKNGKCTVELVIRVWYIKNFCAVLRYNVVYYRLGTVGYCITSV